MWIWAGANIAPINWAVGALGIVRADSRPWPQSAGAAKQCRSARRDGPARECRSSAGPHLSRRHHVHHALAMCDVQRVLLYGISRVVVGENRTFRGEEDLLRSRGVAVEVLQDPRCQELMARFVRAHPSLWAEDIGT